MNAILHARALKRNQLEVTLGTSVGIIYKSKIEGIEKQAQLAYSPFKNVFYAYFTEDNVDFEVKVDNTKVADRNTLVEINFQNEKFKQAGFGYVTKKEEKTYLKSITTYGKSLHFSSTSTTQRFGRLVVTLHYSNKLAQHMNIGIKLPTNGKMLELPVSQYNTIYQVKEMIMKAEGIDIARQEITTEALGKKCYFRNGIMLVEANIEDGAALYLETKDASARSKKKSGNKKLNDSKKGLSAVDHISDAIGKFAIGATPLRIQPSEAFIQLEESDYTESLIEAFRPDKSLNVEYFEIELKFSDKLGK